MVLLERTFPFSAQCEESLLSRIPKTHKKRGVIEDSLEKARAGFRGEENLDYHLSFLPSKNYQIFNDLRLIHENKAFQIDAFIFWHHY